MTQRREGDMAENKYPHRVGWIGAGRMGTALIERLLASDVDLWVYNRTRSKAELLAAKGAKVVDATTGVGLKGVTVEPIEKSVVEG